MIRLNSKVIKCMIVLVGLLAIPIQSIACPTGTPTTGNPLCIAVSTVAATSVTSSTAQLNLTSTHPGDPNCSACHPTPAPSFTGQFNWDTSSSVTMSQPGSLTALNSTSFGSGLSALLCQTQYFFQSVLRATKNTNVDVTGSILNFTTLACGAPSSVTATDGGATNVQVSWGAVSGASFYEVYSKVTGSAATATLLASNIAGLSLTDVTPAQGTNIDYSIKACSLGGCSPFSAVDVGFIAATLPAPPANVQATDGTFFDKVVVTWSVAANASSYDVYRTANGSSQSATLVTNTTGLTYTDTAVTIGTVLGYLVKSCDSVGNCSTNFSNIDNGFVSDGDSDSDNVNNSVDNCPDMSNPGQEDVDGDGVGDVCDTDFVVVLVPSSPPANVSASTGNFTDKVQVTWDAVTNATSYEIYSTLNASNVTASLLNTVSGTLFDDVSPAPIVVVDYSIKACNSGGCSDFSTVVQGFIAAVITVDDKDGDGVEDSQDNCLEIINSNQSNSDGDALGDLCDPDFLFPVSANTGAYFSSDLGILTLFDTQAFGQNFRVQLINKGGFSFDLGDVEAITDGNGNFPAVYDDQTLMLSIPRLAIADGREFQVEFNQQSGFVFQLGMAQLLAPVSGETRGDASFYDSKLKILVLKDVQAGSDHLQVELITQDDKAFSLSSFLALAAQSVTFPASYDTQSLVLSIPTTASSGVEYIVNMIHQGDFIFRLESVVEVTNN